MEKEKPLSTLIIEQMIDNLIKARPLLDSLPLVLAKYFGKEVSWIQRVENGKLYIELEDGTLSTGLYQVPLSRSMRTFVFDLFYQGHGGLFG